MDNRPRPLTEADAEGLEPENTRLQLAKSQVLSIRLSDSELRKVAQAARRAGISVGAFTKRAALKAAEEGPAEPTRVKIDYASGITLHGPSGYQARLAQDNARFELHVTGFEPRPQQMHLIGAGLQEPTTRNN